MPVQVPTSPGSPRRRFNLRRLSSAISQKPAIKHIRSQISFGSILCSVAVFAQSVIGAGLLAFPSAYRQAGYGYIGIIQSILLLLALAGLRVIARCAVLYDAPSYDVMVRRAAGNVWGLLCEIVMLVLLFGACVAYLTVVTDQLESLFENIMATQDTILTHRTVLICFATAAGTALCCVPNISGLWLPSLLSVLSMIFVAALITANYFVRNEISGLGNYTQHASDAEPVPVFVTEFQWVVMCVPILCFGYQGHIAAVPLLFELKRQAEKKRFVEMDGESISSALLSDDEGDDERSTLFPQLGTSSLRAVAAFDKAVILGLAICCLVYNVCGVFGVMTFGTETPSDILVSFNLTVGDPALNSLGNAMAVMVAVARGAVALAVLTTNAILFFCAREVVLQFIYKTKCCANLEEDMSSPRTPDSLYSDSSSGQLETFPPSPKSDSSSPRSSPRRKKCVKIIVSVTVTCVWTVTALCVAVVVPNIGVVLTFTGNFASFFMFVFPGVCLYKTAAATIPDDPDSPQPPESPEVDGVDDDSYKCCGDNCRLSAAVLHMAVGLALTLIGFAIFFLGITLTAFNVVDCQEHVNDPHYYDMHCT